MRHNRKKATPLQERMTNAPRLPCVGLPDREVAKRLKRDQSYTRRLLDLIRKDIPITPW